MALSLRTLVEYPELTRELEYGNVLAELPALGHKYLFDANGEEKGTSLHIFRSSFHQSLPSPLDDV